MGGVRTGWAKSQQRLIDASRHQIHSLSDVYRPYSDAVSVFRAKPSGLSLL